MEAGKPVRKILQSFKLEMWCLDKVVVGEEQRSGQICDLFRK